MKHRCLVFCCVFFFKLIFISPSRPDTYLPWLLMPWCSPNAPVEFSKTLIRVPSNKKEMPLYPCPFKTRSIQA